MAMVATGSTAEISEPKAKLQDRRKRTKNSLSAVMNIQKTWKTYLKKDKNAKYLYLFEKEKQNQSKTENLVKLKSSGKKDFCT